MDENSIKLNAVKIYDKVFTPNVKGYDPDEVDAFLDEIIKDYTAFEKYYTEANTYIGELEESLRKEKEKVRELTVEKARLSNRLEGISDNDDVSLSNIQLLQRIKKLEEALYRLGEDPTKIK